MTSNVLVVDVGTTTLRAALVDARLDVVELRAERFPPSNPAPGMVEFDAAALAAAVIHLANEIVAVAGPVAAVGVTCQRASTIVWDRRTGTPIGPAIGWQDLRTVFECITARAEHDIELLPNQSVTKLAWLVANTPDATGRDLCFGTVDSWLAWSLCGGAEAAVHVIDHTNAAVTGMVDAATVDWDPVVLDIFGIDPAVLPSIVASSGMIAPATAISGAPPLAALVGDQQGSLVGQGCVGFGAAKLTVGTGGMLDVCTGDTLDGPARRSPNGTFPIVARSTAHSTARSAVRHPRGVPAVAPAITWGREAIVLAAGSCVEWLRDDLGVIATADEVETLAASVPDSDGVWFVPALLGSGTPSWDFGARGTLLGVTRGTTKAHLARAVLAGVAHRCADAAAALEADLGTALDTIRVDGGMSANRLFLQLVADATGATLEVSPIGDATVRGAAFLAGLAVGIHPDVAAAERLWRPAAVIQPVIDDATRSAERARWAEATGRAAEWIPELSALGL